LRGFDFSSWDNMLLTVIGVAAFTLISMGIRLMMMFTIQQKRERANRQINERLKTLIAAYKVLGGSFTGTLTVDPTHLRDLRSRQPLDADTTLQEIVVDGLSSTDRSRRMRDAVEAALSDVILLGTEEQVRLAEQAARELVAGHAISTGALVVSLRHFIRDALDLAPIPADLIVPPQGPTRPAGAANRSGKNEGGGGGRGGGGMGTGAGGGMGYGGGSAGADDSEQSVHQEPTP